MKCSLTDCPRLALIPITRLAKGNPPLKLCQVHYFKLMRALERTVKPRSPHDEAAWDETHGEVEADVQGMTNLEIEALISGNEFKRTIARAIARGKNDRRTKGKGGNSSGNR